MYDRALLSHPPVPLPLLVCLVVLSAAQAPRAAGAPDATTVVAETLRVRHGPVGLAGTLVRPRAGGPHAAIVLVHGSGPDDGASYRSMANRFAEAGIAAVVYDKRGSGGSGGDWRRRTLDDLSGDALAFVRALQRRPDVRRQAVGLWGISQGTWVVAHASARDTSVAFAVAISGGGVSPTEQELFHKDEMFRRLGYSPRARAAGVAVWRTIFDGLVQYARGRVPIPAGVVEGPLSGAFLGLDYDPVPDWRRSRQPTLAVLGGHDRLGPVPETIARLRGAFANQPDRLTVRVFPRASHTIGLGQTGLVFDWDSAYAPGYPDVVTAWVRAQTGEPAARALGGIDGVGARSARFSPVGPFGRAPWSERFYPKIGSGLLLLVVFAVVLVGSARWRTREAPGLRGLAVATAALDLAMIAGVAWFIGDAVFEQGMRVVDAYTMPIGLRLLPLGGVASAALGLALAVATIRAYGWHVPRRHAVAVVAVVAFPLWLAGWHLVGGPF